MRWCIYALLNLIAPLAIAQTSDLIGTVGKFGYETGTKGAVTNRQIADQLYHQALQDEQKAWQSFPPNVGLLAKALQQSKDAKAADDQAKEFARAALHSANSGAHSGDFVNERYGMIGESKLKELSTTSSPYAAQVEQRLGKYGMKLSSDKMKLETPFGSFSVNPDDSTLARIATSVAGKLGFSPDDVMNGLSAARVVRDGIAAKTTAALDRQLSSIKADGADAGAPSKDDSRPEEPQSAAAAVIADAGASNPGEQKASSPNYQSLEDAERDVYNRRRAMGLEIGLSGDLSPIGRSTQDIFQMIHSRYKAVEAKGRLLPR